MSSKCYESDHYNLHETLIDQTCKVSLNRRQNGTGTLYWKNGDKLIGHFKDNKVDGLGIKTSADGEIIQQGLWREEVFVGLNEE